MRGGPGRPMRQSATPDRSLGTTRGAGEGLGGIHDASSAGRRPDGRRAHRRTASRSGEPGAGSVPGPDRRPHLAVHDRRPERLFSSRSVDGTPGPEEGEERLEFSSQVSRPGAPAGWAYYSATAPVDTRTHSSIWVSAASKSRHSARRLRVVPGLNTTTERSAAIAS